MASTPARASSGPAFGHAFGFGFGSADPGRRVGVDSVKGKGKARLLDGFDLREASPNRVMGLGSSAGMWSTGSGSISGASMAGTPERSPRKREHGDRYAFTQFVFHLF